ncbi:MAG: hypothetical protein K0S18_1075 [Anaerocolumna sp.]|jgi:hypothetical protein|nr:hypothetical protein [Anaerocolumna sp.]
MEMKSKYNKRKWYYPMFTIVIVTVFCLGITGCSRKPKEEIDNLAESLVMIKSIDTKSKQMEVDVLELILANDENRLAEIGKKKEDLETEYFIYNPDSGLETISYNETTSVELLEEARLELSSIEELEELLSTREVLCNIVTKDKVVISISEQYLP